MRDVNSSEDLNKAWFTTAKDKEALIDKGVNWKQGAWSQEVRRGELRKTMGTKSVVYIFLLFGQPFMCGIVESGVKFRFQGPKEVLEGFLFFLGRFFAPKFLDGKAKRVEKSFSSFRREAALTVNFADAAHDHHRRFVTFKHPSHHWCRVN